LLGTVGNLSWDFDIALIHFLCRLHTYVLTGGVTIIHEGSRISTIHGTTHGTLTGTVIVQMEIGQKVSDSAQTYLQTPLRLPEFFPIGQWNRFK
jgi:hypothetical protein